MEYKDRYDPYGENLDIGFEQEPEDYGDSDFDEPYNVRNIRVEQKMFTVFQVEHWINRGLLNLHPDYQRNLVWDQKRKSALIESLMLKIPIPAFYLDENEDGIKSVIDGLQRLSTIDDFLNDRFQLRNLQYLTTCEKKYFSQLDIRYRSRIEETLLAINILDERCSDLIKFDIFRRVNTGGVHLNPQEIRNIMAYPKVRKLLSDMCLSQGFLDATQKRINDVRMGAREICLRYLTILYAYNWEKNQFEYYHGLLRMMDAMILRLNDMDEKELVAMFFNFEKTMKQCNMVLGELSFCKPDNTAKKINKSLFTSWSVVLSQLRLEDTFLEKNAEAIRKCYLEKLMKDAEFYDVISSSTGYKSNIEISIRKVRSVLEGVL